MEIPGFKLGREFADGEHCKGYNALNLDNHKTVCIQVFDHSLVDGHEFSTQFRDITSKLVGAEFGIMAPILQADISSQACYVVSKYFPSPQQLPAIPPSLTRDQVLQFALQLAQTLDLLHKAGLVHGGIEYSSLYFKTPDQLMLRPVILQRVMPVLSPASFNSLEGGQKRYLAPEASEGLTPATDYYALGVLLYELIVGPVPDDMTDAKLLEEWPSAGENQDLEDFFRQLLAADPGQRIQSLDQFTTTLQQCGIDILVPTPATSETTSVRDGKAEDGETAPRSFPKWIFLTAGLALTALPAMFILLPTLDEGGQRPEQKDTSEEVVFADTPKVEKKQVEQAPSAILAKKDMSETSPVIASLYQQALIQMETNPEAALLNVKAVLKEKPDHSASLKLKHQIEKKLLVRSLINMAEQQLKEQKLLEPRGDNAYETYQALAEELSSDDERVRSGLTKIAAAYHGLAENLFAEERLGEALENVEQGLLVEDDYNPLLQLRININAKIEEEQRKLTLAQLEEQRNREKQNRLKKQQRQLAQQRELKKKQRLLEQQQAVTELKQREEEEAKEIAQKAEEQKIEPLQQDKIDALLKSANDHLKNRRITVKHVFAAHQDYDALQKLVRKSPRVALLKKSLIDAYATLAKRETDEKLYKSAMQAIEQDVPMHPQERKELQIKSQLSFSSF